MRVAACADWDVRDVALVRNMKAEYRSLIQEARGWQPGPFYNWKALAH